MVNPRDPQELLTLPELAEYLKVSPLTIREWRKRQIGPVASLVNGRLRWRLADVDSWIERESAPAA
jgi:predicted DNA-binding transcriptional regulator AlpA